MTAPNFTRGPAIVGKSVRKLFRRKTGEVVTALDNVSIEVRHGALTALVGPDGAGKTTLIRLIAGLMAPDGGSLSVLDVDVVADPQSVQDRTGYMPQKFGLYEDLSVEENLGLYADLRGVSAEERREVYPRLMEMTALGPFTKRLAGRLSGGLSEALTMRTRPPCGTASTIAASSRRCACSERAVSPAGGSRRKARPTALAVTLSGAPSASTLPSRRTMTF